jgi:hypothetical protein
MDESEIHTLFEQEDHVRLYGTDYAEQLCEAGFMVAVRRMEDLFGKEMVRKNGLTPEESLFVCSKGPSALGQLDGVK